MLNKYMPEGNREWKGTVTNKQPKIMVHFKKDGNPDSQSEAYWALLDTGFTELVSIPEAILIGLSFLKTSKYARIHLADGKSVEQLLYSGRILLPYKGWSECFAYSVSDTEIIVGMEFFEDCILVLNNRPRSGRFDILPLKSETFYTSFIRWIQQALKIKSK